MPSKTPSPKKSSKKPKKRLRPKPTYSNKDVLYAADQALGQGYPEKDIRTYFHTKGHHPVEIRWLMRKTPYRRYQLAQDCLIILGLLNTILGASWILLYTNILPPHSPISPILEQAATTEIWEGTRISYLLAQGSYGLLLLLLSFLHHKTKHLLPFLLASILLCIDVLLSFHLAGALDNVLYTLFVKVLLLFWVGRGLIAFTFRGSFRKQNSPESLPASE